ncbi:ROK family transcriptional regulator [Paenarthrobacter nitroguajacolicus]|uniref:ROK family transcriptional regulator n=1 Tax=Paenarthrobacter nitroguajacolicus TaxID=211146 RepID=UPI002857DBDD|nr:ROK family transcriptional regulator [Paenarthrobacter nitroguajacolicus]MDR6640390.1 putative NBD/HSP70 family sugar kinase [Paenarthrobacter nitroguajacolicus]
MAIGAPQRLRILNDQTALGFILDAGSISRAELEKLTGLSKPATTELLNRLEAAGLAEKSGKRDGGPGPSAQLWRVRPEAGYGAAVEVQPGKITVTIADLAANPVAHVQQSWNASSGAADVGRCIDAACDDAGLVRSQLLHLVVAIPGALDPRTGMLRYAPHLPAWNGTNVTAALRSELGIPTDVENDVNLMALSEMKNGLAEQAENFALVWIDDGVGSAIVLRKELFTGLTGGAGEIDYLPVSAAPGAGTEDPQERLKLGDLLSPEAISDLATAHGLKYPLPEKAIAAAAADDDVVHPFIQDLASRIALGLAAIVTVLDPDLIMLGGKFGAAGGQNLASVVQEELSRVLATSPASATRIVSYPVTDGAALSGALQTALAKARDKAFATGSIVTP